MILAHAVPPFAARGLLGNMDEETDWRRKWERLKHKGSTISLQAEVLLGHMPWALKKRTRRRRTTTTTRRRRRRRSKRRRRQCLGNL
jgi:hypothetical protein